MIRHVAFVLSACSFVSCAPEADPAPVARTGEGWVLEGELPEGADLEQLVSDLAPGGFAVVGDPSTGELATLISTTSPLARTVGSSFSALSVTCVDCGTGCGPGTTRTIEVQLQQNGGANGTTHTVVTTSSSNFASPVHAPATFTGAIGGSVTVATTGTLSTCTTFSHFFDVEAPARVFVTSKTTKGDFGGAATGDALCQARANAASLGGTWKAWLSDGTLASPSPVDRFTGNGPWVRSADQAPIADDLTDLTDGTLANTINLDEFGADVGNVGVFTGVNANGNANTGNCANWTTTVGNCVRGVSGQSGTGWTRQSTGESCNNARRLYCFEQ